MYVHSWSNSQQEVISVSVNLFAHVSSIGYHYHIKNAVTIYPV
jgi:hypothetical protein